MEENKKVFNLVCNNNNEINKKLVSLVDKLGNNLLLWLCKNIKISEESHKLLKEYCEDKGIKIFKFTIKTIYINIIIRYYVN